MKRASCRSGRDRARSSCADASARGRDLEVWKDSSQGRFLIKWKSPPDRMRCWIFIHGDVGLGERLRPSRRSYINWCCSRRKRDRRPTVQARRQRPRNPGTVQVAVVVRKARAHLEAEVGSAAPGRGQSGSSRARASPRPPTRTSGPSLAERISVKFRCNDWENSHLLTFVHACVYSTKPISALLQASGASFAYGIAIFCTVPASTATSQVAARRSAADARWLEQGPRSPWPWCPRRRRPTST